MRLVKLILILLAWSGAAYSRGSLQGYCEDGNQTVTTSGLMSLTKVQRSYPSCTVTVYLTGTTTLASIYSNNSGTVLANPFTATTTGYWQFFAENATYDIKLSGGGIITPFTHSGQILTDPGIIVVNVTQSSFGAKGDGTTNDSPAFQAAIDYCPSTGCYITVPRSSNTYVLATEIAVSKSNVTWDINAGAEIRFSTLTGTAHTGVHDSSGVLSAFYVTGTSDTFTGKGLIKSTTSANGANLLTAILCNGCSKLTADGVGFSGGYTTIWFGGGATDISLTDTEHQLASDNIICGFIGGTGNNIRSPQVNRITLNNVNSHNAGRDGIKMTSYCQDYSIQGGKYHHNTDGGIDTFIGGQNGIVNGALITDNVGSGIDGKYRDDTQGSDTGDGANQYGWTRRSIFTNNQILRNKDGITYCTFAYTTNPYPDPGGADVYNGYIYGPVEELLIQGNTIQQNSVDGMLFCGTRALVNNNIFKWNGVRAIQYQWSSDVDMSHNQFIDNGVGVVNGGQPNVTWVQATSDTPIAKRFNISNNRIVNTQVGGADTFTATGSTITTTSVHTFALNDIVFVSTDNTLPPPLVKMTPYWVVATTPASKTLQVSTVHGGTPVTFTGAGSGTHFICARCAASGLFLDTINEYTLSNNFTSGMLTTGYDFSGVSIIGAVDNGSGLIRLQSSAASNVETNHLLSCFDVGGVPASDGVWRVTRIDSTHFDLIGSTFAGTYTTGGTCRSAVRGENNYDYGSTAAGIPTGWSFGAISGRFFMGSSEMWFERQGTKSIALYGGDFRIGHRDDAAGIFCFERNGVCTGGMWSGSNRFSLYGGTDATKPNIELSSTGFYDTKSEQRVATTLTNLAAGATAVTVTWPITWVDNAYFPLCSVVDAGTALTSLKVDHISAVATGTMTVIVNNGDSSARSGVLNCRADHK